MVLNDSFRVVCLFWKGWQPHLSLIVFMLFSCIAENKILLWNMKFSFKNWKGLKLTHLEDNKLVCQCFIGAGREPETLESEMRDIQNSSRSQMISICFGSARHTPHRAMHRGLDNTDTNSGVLRETLQFKAPEYFKISNNSIWVLPWREKLFLSSKTICYLNTLEKIVCN